MANPRQDLTVPQGTSWGISWPILDADGALVNVTGWTVHAQVRARVDSPTVLHEWSTAEGTAVADGTTVTLILAPATSTAWTWQAGVYDVEVTDTTGRVARIAQGRIRVDPEVTRA